MLSLFMLYAFIFHFNSRSRTFLFSFFLFFYFGKKSFSLKKLYFLCLFFLLSIMLQKVFSPDCWYWDKCELHFTNIIRACIACSGFLTERYLFCWPYHIYIWPPRWSSGQRVWLLIMRSRVRSPALPQILNVD